MNDIVLAILELLKFHQRVLYIDIDVHHGDGVEEAFYCTDRVMTVSFHKFGEFFPGTGDLTDIGHGKGKFHSVNVPLRDGIDDESYEQLFKPIMTKVMERFQPEAIVFQSGADSLSGDRLGFFNLSIRGHAECLKFMGTFGVPIMLLGGGGYTVRNVARCWTYETACLLGCELEDKLPQNDYYEYFGPEFRLHYTPSNMENQNTYDSMERVRRSLLCSLDNIPISPSVAFHARPPEAPIDAVVDPTAREQEADPDKRFRNSEKASMAGDGYDSDDDAAGRSVRNRSVGIREGDKGENPAAAAPPAAPRAGGEGEAAAAGAAPATGEPGPENAAAENGEGVSRSDGAAAANGNGTAAGAAPGKPEVPQPAAPGQDEQRESPTERPAEEGQQKVEAADGGHAMDVDGKDVEAAAAGGPEADDMNVD